jgi:hypothetical protein
MYICFNIKKMYSVLLVQATNKTPSLAQIVREEGLSGWGILSERIKQVWLQILLKVCNKAEEMWKNSNSDG